MYKNTQKTLLNCWREQFSNTLPIAHQLKTAFPDRWVRFHSLPDSKRYPQDEEEYNLLLGRHNCILGELTKLDDKFILLTAGYSSFPKPVRNCPDLQLLDPKATPWKSIPLHEVENENFGEPYYMHVFASKWRWNPKCMDNIIRLAAMDKIDNLMLASPDCRWLLHPYDGGMDLITESTDIRNHYKSDYWEWLSQEASGL